MSFDSWLSHDRRLDCSICGSIWHDTEDHEDQTEEPDDHYYERMGWE